MTLIKLGRTLSATDSAEKERRAGLFARAAAILHSPEAEGRIALDGQAARAELEALRAANGAAAVH